MPQRSLGHLVHLVVGYPCDAQHHLALTGVLDSNLIKCAEQQNASELNSTHVHDVQSTSRSYWLLVLLWSCRYKPVPLAVVAAIFVSGSDAHLSSTPPPVRARVGLENNTVRSSPGDNYISHSLVFFCVSRWAYVLTHFVARHPCPLPIISTWQQAQHMS